MVLTARQREELHSAMLEYLDAAGEQFPETAKAFRAEANLENAQQSGRNLLEKKWVTVVRLQRRVLDLERQLKEAKSAEAPNLIQKGDGRMLPRTRRHGMEGHRGPVTAVAFHPTVPVLATASEDASIGVWDAEAGSFERSLRGHTLAVNSVCFSKSGNLLASSAADLTIKLWDFGADATFSCLRTLRGHDHNVSAVAFLNGDEVLASASRDGSIRLWDAPSGFSTRTLRGAHTDWVRCLAADAAGRYLVSGSSDHLAAVWNAQTGDVVATLRGHEHVVECVAVAPAGARGPGPGREGGEERKDEGPPLLVASGGRDGAVRLWNALAEQCLHCFSDHENWVRGLLWHANGKFVLSCGDDRTIRVYDVKAGRACRTIDDAHGHFATCLAMHSRLPMLASGGVDRAANIWDLR